MVISPVYQVRSMTGEMYVGWSQGESDKIDNSVLSLCKLKAQRTSALR